MLKRSNITISIIIPVFNANSTLALCLDSIKRLDYPKDKIQVIIVDNNSCDNSAEIAESFDVTLLYETSTQSSYVARNRGIAHANGKLIVFTDADCIVDRNWLKYLIRDYSNPSIGCFAGEIEAYQPASIVEKFSERMGLLRQKGPVSGWHYLPFAQTANAAYRKDVLDMLNGFNPDFISGGDADLCWRMQKIMDLKISFVPEAIVYHRHRTSVTGLYKQFRKYELGKFTWYKYYPDYQLPTTSQRFTELLKSIKSAILSFPILIKYYLTKKIDFVDLIYPFLKVVTHFGALSGQLKHRKAISIFR